MIFLTFWSSEAQSELCGLCHSLAGRWSLSVSYRSEWMWQPYILNWSLKSWSGKKLSAIIDKSNTLLENLHKNSFLEWDPLYFEFKRFSSVLLMGTCGCLLIFYSRISKPCSSTWVLYVWNTAKNTHNNH